MTPGWALGTLRSGPLPEAGQVVKVGGSLLAMPGWPEALAALVAGLPASLVVVGGGGVVDGLRAIDAASPRPRRLTHDLAIDAMALTARIVADALDLPVVAPAVGGGGVLDAAAWLSGLEISSPGSQVLPVGWHVTSDSIAATVAAVTRRGLVLAKRVPPPERAHDLERLAAAGWVDPHFPVAAAGVAPIAWAAPG